MEALASAQGTRRRAGGGSTVAESEPRAVPEKEEGSVAIGTSRARFNLANSASSAFGRMLANSMESVDGAQGVGRLLSEGDETVKQLTDVRPEWGKFKLDVADVSETVCREALGGLFSVATGNEVCVRVIVGADVFHRVDPLSVPCRDF